MSRFWPAILIASLVQTSALAQDNPQPLELAIDIEIESTTGDVEQVSRRVIFGQGWVHDNGVDETTLYDFMAHEDWVLNPAEETYRLVPTHAVARENIDIYFALSNGGQETIINFGDAGSFHRFWLESAIDVRAQTAELSVTDDQDTRRWTFQSEEVVSARFGVCQDDISEPVSGAMFAAWFRRVAPIHPEISNALAEEDLPPCEIKFVIYSPDSPQGRTETWTLSSLLSSDFNPDNLARETPDPLDARSSADTDNSLEVEPTSADQAAPDPMTFASFIDEAIAAENYAGAALLALQETHHFGPCPEQIIGSVRQACLKAIQLPELAENDNAFEQISVAIVASLSGNHERAAGLSYDFLVRQDREGAAARMLFATSLMAMRANGQTAYPDLDPLQILADAIHQDPYTSDAYWYLGQALIARREYEAGWAVFEKGLALVEDRPESRLSQIMDLESQIESLAPGYFPELGTVN